ncbi:MAG: hypothetical protein H7070_04770 [Saprospiraceae bacterium]|nr:hypothetical protein [Pyrinomonadaceae bacterium]
MEGLPVVTEDWADGTSGTERKRWTWTSYTQDDTNLTYLLNPRVTESKVGDTTNIKRTTVEYRFREKNNRPAKRSARLWL